MVCGAQCKYVSMIVVRILLSIDVEVDRYSIYSIDIQLHA